MKMVSRSLVGFFAGAAGTLAMLTLIYFSAWGKDVAPRFNVDTTPIVRDAKIVTSYAPVVKKAAPSVVNIYSTHIIHMRPMINPLFNDPFFRQFFGQQTPQGQELTRKEQSLGSGVIVTPDGYILTANHVVRGADVVKVSLGDDTRKEYPAKIVGTDPRTDVAVLKIDAQNLPSITFGDSDQLEIGDVVLAIGNPFGVGQTVSHGIVSALGRHGYGINGPRGYEDFIQTDAPINPGNSGGALVDADGRLIGINTWIASSSGGSEGVGFSVPANLARRVMESLITSGKVSRGYLGVSIKDVTPSLSKAFGYSGTGGALVGDVFKDTPAAKAGIKSGDIITKFDNKPIQEANDLTLMVSESSPETEVTLQIFRKGDFKNFTVKLESLPNEAGGSGGSQKNTTTSSTHDALDGVTVDNLNGQIRDDLQIPDDIHGVIVSGVDPNSNSADAGLEKNDVIMEIDQQPVRNADDAVRLAEDANGDQILLKIWRRQGDLASTTFLAVDNTKKQK